MKWISSEKFLFFLFQVDSDKLITLIHSRLKYGQEQAETHISLIFYSGFKDLKDMTDHMFIEPSVSAKTLTFTHCSTVWNFIPCFHPNSWLPQHSAEVQWEKIGSSAFRLSRFQTVTTASAAIKSPTGLSLHQQSPSLMANLIHSPCPDPKCPLGIKKKKKKSSV